MINVGLYYKVKPGHEKEFEDTFRGVVEMLTKANVGITSAKLYREIGSSEYMIYTEWKSLESFRGFIQSRGFKETTIHGQSIIDGTPRHRIFNEDVAQL